MDRIGEASLRTIYLQLKLHLLRSDTNSDIFKPGY